MIRRYRVGWLFTISGIPIQDATVTVENGRIAAVEEAGIWPDAVDLSQWALLPALVNPHTHLEFSNLTQPLGTPGMPLAEWIGQVIGYRQSLGDNLAVEKAHAIRAGLRESAAHGVGVVGEITTLPFLETAYAHPQVRVVSLLECLGLNPQQLADLTHQAQEHVAAHWSKGSITSGLSPHAPYSTRVELVERCAELSHARRVPLAMHLAESLDELRLLERAEGAFHDMLDQLGLFSADDFPGEARILDYLERLRPAYRALVVHGNYLGVEEIAYLADHADRMLVCYCPRTHAYFQHDRHPIEELLANRIRVVLGTDSRASSPDLNLWEEVRYLQKLFPNIPLEQVLPMVTRDAAWALGLEADFGTIEPDRVALVSAFPIGADVPDPYIALLGHQPRLWDLDQGLTQLDLATA